MEKKIDVFLCKNNANIGLTCITGCYKIKTGVHAQTYNFYVITQSYFLGKQHQ